MPLGGKTPRQTGGETPRGGVLPPVSPVNKALKSW